MITTILTVALYVLATIGALTTLLALVALFDNDTKTNKSDFSDENNTDETNTLQKGEILETQIVNGIEFLKVRNFSSIINNGRYFTKTGNLFINAIDPCSNEFISTKILLSKYKEKSNTAEEQELFFVTDLSENRLTRDDLRSMNIKSLTETHSIPDLKTDATLVKETKLVTETKTYDVLNYYDDFVIFIESTPYIFTVEDATFVIQTKQNKKEY